MPLKFVCPQCQQVSIIRYLKIGETTQCKSCGTYSTIPEDTPSITEEEANALSGISSQQPVPTSKTADALPKANAISALRFVAGFIAAGFVLIGFFMVIGLVAMFAIDQPNSTDSPILGALAILLILAAALSSCVFLMLMASMAEHLLDIRKRVLDYDAAE